MKILLTGASSFTGFWFARELVARGHEVICTMTKDSLDDYEEEARTERIKLLAASFRIATGVEFGTGKFCDLITENSIDLLCLHGAHSPERQTMRFPLAEAFNKNVYNIHLVMEILAARRTPFLLSGTVFERGEGAADSHSSSTKKKEQIPELIGGRLPEAASPYGLCKTIVSEAFEYYSKKLNIPMAKIIIPNPFGPNEDRRYTRHLMEHWSKGESVSVKTPQYIRDNIPIKLLAKAYGDLAEARVQNANLVLVRRPSAYRESMADFTKRLATEVRSRTGWKCEYTVPKQTEFLEPMSRINTDSVFPSDSSALEAEAWSELVAYYRQ